MRNNHSKKVHRYNKFEDYIAHTFYTRRSSFNSYLKVFHVKMYVPSGETSLKLVFASSVKSLCGYKGAIKRRNKIYNSHGFYSITTEYFAFFLLCFEFIKREQIQNYCGEEVE